MRKLKNNEARPKFTGSVIKKACMHFGDIMRLSMFSPREGRRGRCGAFDQTCPPESGEFDWKVHLYGRAI